MEQIKVTVDWCGKNYASYIDDPRICGVVLSTAKTFEKLQHETENSLKFHLEGCIADGDPVAEPIRNGDYELVYERRVSAILHEAQQFTTLAAISRVTGKMREKKRHKPAAIQQQ